MLQLTYANSTNVPASSSAVLRIRVVLDLVSQVRDAVLMNVYLDLGNSGGSGFRDGGYMNKGREMGSSVYEQPGNKVDGSYHSKEGPK